jgi:calcineurin-like phosphoesterase
VTNLLFIGDIVGRPGRELVRRAVPALVAKHRIDLVIANVENAAAGFGITPDLADDLLSFGVQVMTGGNHTWDKKEIVPYFSHQPRPAAPGEHAARHRWKWAVCRHGRQWRARRRHQRHGPRVHDAD